MSSCIPRIADFAVPVLAFSRHQTMIYITPVGLNTETLTRIDVFCMKTVVLNVELQTKITANVIMWLGRELSTDLRISSLMSVIM